MSMHFPQRRRLTMFPVIVTISIALSSQKIVSLYAIHPFSEVAGSQPFPLLACSVEHDIPLADHCTYPHILSNAALQSHRHRQSLGVNCYAHAQVRLLNLLSTT